MKSNYHRRSEFAKIVYYVDVMVRYHTAVWAGYILCVFQKAISVGFPVFCSQKRLSVLLSSVFFGGGGVEDENPRFYYLCKFVTTLGGLREVNGKEGKYCFPDFFPRTASVFSTTFADEGHYLTYHPYSLPLSSPVDYPNKPLRGATQKKSLRNCLGRWTS